MVAGLCSRQKGMFIIAQINLPYYSKIIIMIFVKFKASLMVVFGIRFA
jgi:hypothetical protein